MDVGKARGDYASAYKLSRATIDRKAQRRQRRSIEQREFRHDEVNKRRNLNDLSPLDEQDLASTQDKNYKGKTPQKPRVHDVARKGLDRLEQLKKWKLERERKKKMDIADNRNINPVFRVSTAVVREDTRLFGKTIVKKHPVKPQPAPDTKPATHISNPATFSSNSKTHVEDRPRCRHTSGDKRQTSAARSSSRNFGTKKPEPVTERVNKKGKVAVTNVASGRTLRSSRQPNAPVEPITRIPRQSTRSKATSSSLKRKAVPKQECEPNARESVYELSATKITRRGDTSELPDSFAQTADFGFNATSFVFQPLSPASAAGFLGHNPDNSCSSFLETNPKRSSTPKEDKGNDGNVTCIDEQTNNDITQNVTVLDRTAIEQNETTVLSSPEVKNTSNVRQSRLSKRVSEMGSKLDIAETDKPLPTETVSEEKATPRQNANHSAASTVVSKEVDAAVERVKQMPRLSRRRSVLSVSTVLEDCSTTEDNVEKPGQTDSEKKATPRQNANHSAASTVVSKEVDAAIAAVERVKQTPRRSQRRSVLSTNTILEDSSTTEDNVEKAGHSSQPRSVAPAVHCDSDESTSVVVEGVETMKQMPRRSLRRSILSASKILEDSSMAEDDTEKPKCSSRRQSHAAAARADAVSPVKRRRISRRSLTIASGDVESPAKSMTPSRELRQNRRSIAVVCEPETIPEISEGSDTSDGSNDVFMEDNEVEDGEDKENCGPDTVKDGSMFRTSSDTAVDDAKNTPKTTEGMKNSRNKSFGEFRLPNSDSAVLSCKRNPRRKTLMPKSPEEWIEVLSSSPMIEMSRRKHKSGNASLPMLSWDDADEEEPKSSMVTEDVKITETVLQSAAPVAMVEHEVFPAVMETVDEAITTNDAKDITDGRAVVEVGEPSCTQDGPSSNESSSGGEHDVPYFRTLMSTETNRLNGLSDHWNVINNNTTLTEEVHGQIRTTVGQAKLLMNQRFKQFLGLVDDCEFKLGERETTCMDLKGFWEMIYYQVEDVDKKFDDLTKLKENNWVDDKPKPMVKKTKKKVSKPVASKPAVKSKFSAFRAQIKKQEEDSVSSTMLHKPEEQKVFEVPGFFQVSSPVRSPKPHCEGGTPRKVTPASTTSSEESAAFTNNLVVPGSNELMVVRTPSRKSYLPAVPSPLLRDTTPLPRPSRACTQKTPIPNRIIDEADNSEPSAHENENMWTKRTPTRRSLRSRKSVNFTDSVDASASASPVAEGTEADIARLLQPTTASEPTEDGMGDADNESFSKYLQPLSVLDTSIDKEDTPRQGRSRRSTLKSCKSTERRRTRQHSVHFVSPTYEDTLHVKLPNTPYSRNSLVKQKRVTKSSRTEEGDIFNIENIDNDENVPPPTCSSARPSLLGTPPNMKRRRARATAEVPTGILISFTP